MARGAARWALRSGHFAAVTNYSEGAAAPTGVLRSRGELSADFLAGSQAPSAFMNALAQRADQYRGFSLLVGDGRDLFYFTNRGGDPLVPLLPHLDSSP